MDEKCKILEYVKMVMSKDLSIEQINKLNNTLVSVLDKYDVTLKSTDLALYDDTNEKALQFFTGILKMQSKSDGTIEQYINATRKCMNEIGKNYKDINDFDMIKYFAHLSTTVSCRTYNNYIRYINQFFKWLCDDCYIQINPMRKIKIVSEDKVIKKPYTNAEMSCLRDNAESLRDKALITFLYSTGLRISEALRLNKSDAVNNQVIAFGKGRKERYVSINDVARYYLNLYLDSRTDNEDALFVTNKNAKGYDHPTRFTKSGAEDMLRKLGKKCGIDNVHPHRFRRTLCCSLLEKGMPIQEVQVVLGHANISTTTLYNYVNPEQLQSKLSIFS